ncbi:MAG: DUF5615 family PIN-like protein [Candidatus Omnitrophota bacterium]
MKFLIDENVRFEIETFLVESGHNVRRVASGAKNGEVIQSALAEKRVLITHDIHFSNILAYPPDKYCGIIRIRIDPPSADKITLALKGLLDKTPSERFDKRLFVLEEDGFRVR